MSFSHRIHTIYRKELTDILRDRRTLIAMIVVPIVLYPLLMLGSIQAVSLQTENLKDEKIVIGFTSQQQGERFQRMIERDAAMLKRKRVTLDPESEEYKSVPAPLSDASLREFPPHGEVSSRDIIRREIEERRVQVGVIFDDNDLIGVRDLGRQVHVEILADTEEIRSSTAEKRVHDLLERVNTSMRNERLAGLGLPQSTFEPFPVATTDLSAPPSILGQVLPLILILMTITGAIYPAIDLTAGERERGTLESLMVCPVPTVDLIVGKFLVVTTVAIMGAALNLASVTATVYFGGFGKILAQSGGSVPVLTMFVILLCLIPFAVLMSAIMLAVCSYARTFKEAQNYVTPVILAVLIPGGIAALPATTLTGIMLVMPVGNMVLLARDFLLGSSVPLSTVAIVLLSTSLYAFAAVAIAANIFGHESVVFSDAGSWRGLLARRKLKPQTTPRMSTGLMFVALLFPMWFFVQSSLSSSKDASAAGHLFATGWLMPILFVLVPLAGLLYGKVGVASTFGWKWPPVKYVVAGVLIGLSAWVPTREISVIQSRLVEFPKTLLESGERLTETIGELPFGVVLVLIAFIPAVCEELLFRGFLLNSLRRSSRKWTAILASALIFATYHFFIYRFVVTAALGVVLGYLCWQSRSIFPAMIAHFLHNGLGALSIAMPKVFEWMGISTEDELAHLPAAVLIVGFGVFAAGLALCSRREAADLDLVYDGAPSASEAASG